MEASTQMEVSSQMEVKEDGASTFPHGLRSRRMDRRRRLRPALVVRRTGQQVGKGIGAVVAAAAIGAFGLILVAYYSGAELGISAVVVAFIVAVALVGWWMWRRRRRITAGRSTGMPRGRRAGSARDRGTRRRGRPIG
jgi:Flp pilus assembly protein TadB